MYIYIYVYTYISSIIILYYYVCIYIYIYIEICIYIIPTYIIGGCDAHARRRRRPGESRRNLGGDGRPAVPHSR